MEDLLNDSFKRLIATGKSRTIKKGETLIRPDDMLKHVYYLESGYIREYSISVTGLELTVHIFAPTSLFPMTWILGDMQNRYYYEAFTDVRIVLLNKKIVVDFLKSNPDVLLSFTKKFLVGLDKLSSRIESFIFFDSYRRVVSSLIYLVHHFGKVSDEGTVFDRKISHVDISVFAGTSRETASRQLGRLKRKELLEIRNGHLIVKGAELLKGELV